MNENKVLKVKSLLYNVDIDETKKAIFQIQDQEILYMYTYNYNWDNGFVIPQIILDNKKCDLSIALLIFYRVDGLRYLTNKSDNEKLSHWFSFVKKLYYSILTGKYQKGKIGFKVPLSRVQIFKLKKVISEKDNIFIENIEGKCLDIDL